MSESFAHSQFHPKWYRQRMSTYWWLWRWAYLKFILREISSAFVAYSVAVILAQIWSVGQGAETYARFNQWLESPVALILNGIALVFVLIHAVTWFNLAPKAVVVKVGGRRVPGILIAGANHALWLVISLVVLWVLIRKG
ncbi:MAG: fumarate reductase subunit C [Phycisphaerae bacterium]|nr:fumarate reductase subunit C [Phycisphaerae bacterium]